MVVVLLIIISPLSLAGQQTTVNYCTLEPTVSYSGCSQSMDEFTMMLFSNTTMGFIRKDQVVEDQQVIPYFINSTEFYPNCTNPSCNEACISTRCKGDTNYCSLFQCSNTSNPCNCGVISIRNIVTVCDYKGNCGEVQNSDVDIEVYFSYEQGYLSINKDPDCNHALNDLELIITCESETTLRVQKDQWSVILETSGRVVRIGLPKTAISISGTFMIFSIDETGANLVDSFYYDSETETEVSTCPTSDCILCSSTIDNFNCQSKTMKFFIVCVLIVLTVLFFSVFTWVLYILLISFNLLYRTLLSVMWLMKKSALLSKHGYVKIKDMWRKVDEGDSLDSREEMESESKDLELKEVKLDKMKKPRVVHDDDPEVPVIKTGQSKKSRLMRAAVIGGMLKTADSQCTGGVTQFSVTTSCVRDLYNETCTYSNFQALVSLPFSGTTACLTFMNQDNSSVVSVVNVSFVEQIQYCSLVQQYYTSNWVGNFESHRSCYTPSNWCGGRCDSMSPNDASCSSQCTNSAVTTKPGVTGCSRTCGCAGCGCFYCTSACLPYRWALTPTNPIYTVSLAPTCEYRTVMSACMNDTCDYSSRFRSGTSVSINGFTITSVGNFPSPIATIGTKKICKTGVDTFLCDAANLNSPNRAIPGDIQAGFLQNLTNANPTSFIFARDIANVNIGQTSATATFSSPGVSINMLKLPILYNQRVWETDGANLIANETQSSSFLFTISSPGSFKLVRKLDLVCPRIVFLSLSGCYSCPIGAVAKFSVKSDCLSGSALLSFPSEYQLSSDAVMLTQSLTNYTTVIYTNRTSLNFDITFTANGGTVTSRVVGDLKSYSEVLGENSTSVTSEDSSSDWDKFSNFYTDKLFGNWWRITLSSLAHLILTIIMIGIVYNLTKATAKAASKKST